jgi:hypothetical protein
MTRLYRVFVTVTAMPLETVSAKDPADAIAQVRAMYPQRNDSLTAILIREIQFPPLEE